MAPVVMADLVPHHKTNEILLDVCKERPTIFVFGSNPIILGRNRTTQISMVNISRQLCRIQHNGQSLTLVSLKESNALQVNGVPVLSQGTIITLNDNDIISLLDNDYQYQVVMRQYEQNEQFNTTINEESPPPMEELDQHGLDDEFICAVCLNIIVKASACHPCGHIFCHDCIHMATFCHMCRTKMVVMPMKHVDNVIWKLVKMGGIFLRDDVEPYLERNTDVNLTDIEVNQKPIIAMYSAVQYSTVQYCQSVCSLIMSHNVLVVLPLPKTHPFLLSYCSCRELNSWVHSNTLHDS